jgi:hypothetical protein
MGDIVRFKKFSRPEVSDPQTIEVGVTAKKVKREPRFSTPSFVFAEPIPRVACN